MAMAPVFYLTTIIFIPLYDQDRPPTKPICTYICVKHQKHCWVRWTVFVGQPVMHGKVGRGGRLRMDIKYNCFQTPQSLAPKLAVIPLIVFGTIWKVHRSRIRLLHKYVIVYLHTKLFSWLFSIEFSSHTHNTVTDIFISRILHRNTYLEEPLNFWWPRRARTVAIIASGYRQRKNVCLYAISAKGSETARA